MDRLVERCAGLDVHKDSVAATVRVPGKHGQRLQETRASRLCRGAPQMLPRRRLTQSGG